MWRRSEHKHDILPTNEPSNAFGVKPHSDPNTITILTQDEVGGLEVREKHGEWIQVKPTPYAFIVNVGDQLEVRVRTFFQLQIEIFSSN